MSFEELLFFQHHVGERLVSLFNSKLYLATMGPDVPPPGKATPYDPLALWTEELERDLDHAADVLVAAWRYPSELQPHLAYTCTNPFH